MTATIETIDLAEMSADAVAAENMLAYLKDYVDFHRSDAQTVGETRVDQFNARCVRMVRVALEAALRDGAECAESDIAAVIAGDFLDD